MKFLKLNTTFFSIFGVLIVLTSCKEKPASNSNTLAMSTSVSKTEALKKEAFARVYRLLVQWYRRNTSYNLNQADPGT